MQKRLVNIFAAPDVSCVVTSRMSDFFQLPEHFLSNFSRGEYWSAGNCQINLFQPALTEAPQDDGKANP